MKSAYQRDSYTPVIIVNRGVQWWMMDKETVSYIHRGLPPGHEEKQTYATTWMRLENIRLRGISQTQTHSLSHPEAEKDKTET